MWGIPIPYCNATFSSRITPTYVGNTNPCRRSGGLWQDHPHLCGEYTVRRSRSTLRLGSPPPMWGILLCLSNTAKCQRITPTYVGNTRVRYRRDCPTEDHPHLCGEYTPCEAACGACTGSPPPMWGIRVGPVLSLWIVGITPTYVGNTPSNGCSSPLQRDHPHLCGEYASWTSPADVSLGSPPPMWGILKQEGLKHNDGRITPTYVGNTGVTSFGIKTYRDHPHLCGEYC